MKLWDSLTACLILLSAVRAGPLFHGGQRAAESPLELPPVRLRLSAPSPGNSRFQADTTGTAGREGPLAGAGKYNVDEALPSEVEDVVDFIRVTISRIRRSSSSTVSTSTSPSSASPPPREKLGSSTRYRRERKKGASQQRAKGGSGGAGVGETGRKVRGGGGSGRGQGCVLKQIHLNVSDLGLGYRSGEEMIFRYCSGPCRKSETNYDKILSNLAHNRRLPPKDRPSQACCRPTAFDDDLSFLDDNLVYHTVRKHSARKCGCV